MIITPDQIAMNDHSRFLAWPLFPPSSSSSFPHRTGSSCPCVRRLLAQFDHICSVVKWFKFPMFCKLALVPFCRSTSTVRSFDWVDRSLNPVLNHMMLVNI